MCYHVLIIKVGYQRLFAKSLYKKMVVVMKHLKLYLNCTDVLTTVFDKGSGVAQMVAPLPTGLRVNGLNLGTLFTYTEK